ncbi:malectin domain-containing carbohydrate-binding protein [Chitinophagaceae bacterium LB-8]|uniref:Malectin domain-containing carbohydrate-binding protein n=1 Tax=Paraflavisolibacter caeni TaxID=2982496 RepID=A0A9X2XU67_9BACT|nr:glycoside hydrolase family 2 TIM barrel-domain containing protein [Paraflavisolibacter caeni]MCU7547728.1 malectin domain-containing carbohydrate-binding protein [Paraflavisolibacter caeni]
MRLILFLIFSFFSIAVFAQSSRIVQTLNAGWKFHKSNAAGLQEMLREKEDWQQVNLPHCFNAEDGEDEKYGYYRGSAWYLKEISFDSTYLNHRIFVYFEAANQVCELFVNGIAAGKHIGGYGSFCFEITSLIRLGEKNVLTVQVDNRHNEDIPPLDADFSFMGGIYRDVYLITTNTVHFDLLNNGSNGVFIETPIVTEQAATCRLRATIKNDGTTKQKIFLHTRITNAGGKMVATKSTAVTILPDQLFQAEQNGLSIPTPHLWSPDSPYLYTVTTEITDSNGRLIDQVSHPLGLRWYTFDAAKGFILNGKPLKLIGVNRHQFYTHQGFALSNEQHVHDIELLKQMGGNCIRIAHYQQDPAILEACDRLGIIATEEIPIVNYIHENSKDFRTNCLNMAVELVRRDYNHPSIFVWAYMNEMLNNNKPKKPENMRLLNRLAVSIDSILHVEDKNRFTMIPNAEWFEGYRDAGLIDLPQICGWNIYEGWYGEKLSDFERFMDNFHKQYPDKPVMITEYGAGADPRVRSFAPERFDFSMEYQNIYHEHYLKAIMERPFIAGAFVWAFVDFYAEPRVDATPHVNNKGLLTLDRKLKDCYFLYQAYLQKTPLVSIASKGWAQREGCAARTDENFCKQPVTIYSNQQEIELFLQGQLLEKKSVVDHKAVFEVPFTNGSNLLEAVCTAGGNVIKDAATIQFRLWDFPLSKHPESFPAIHVNAGSNYSYYDEKNQCTWLADQEYSKGSWGYTSGKRYRAGSRPASQREIGCTQDEPLFQTQQTDPGSYRFDVPDGQYEVSLYFAELLSEAQMQKSLYNLSADATVGKAVKRIFNVDINGSRFLRQLNLKEQFGEAVAVPFKYIIDVRDGRGIEIKFSALAGVPVINALSVVRIK